MRIYSRGAINLFPELSLSSLAFVGLRDVP